ncbi:hypothetical protein GQ42DRAFT_82714 [Ramicandelaber brevisporus]|nr:hypothetical protein GQ42DRAFT_82714 [Ramicandelaber brevisporus]
MMTNDDDEQLDELQQQQQQQQQQPTLPLLYLPIELAEEISLYFEGRTAAKLLRVSRSFHSLFLPRVWTVLNNFTKIEDNEARQHMLEKYGHFVRTISFTSHTMGLFTFDWLPFVKRATYLNANIDYETTAEEAETLIKLIKRSKMLRTLDLCFMDYDTPVMFDELAAAVNELEYIECITCEFRVDYASWGEGGEWKYAAGFADMLHRSKRSKLRLKMDCNTSYNEVDVQALAPYVVELEAYGLSTCIREIAHEFFGITDNNGQPLVFPQLRELSMGSCCFNDDDYGVDSITANRLPQLRCLYFSAGSCNLLDRGEQNQNNNEKDNWKPEYSDYAHIIIPYQRWHCLTDLYIDIVSSSILMRIARFNPQLRRLSVRAERSKDPNESNTSKYNHDKFQLDAILDRLPRLVYFSIGRLNSRLTADPAAIPATRRYKLRMFIGRQMSIAPSAAAYILQMPQLTNVVFSECVFADVDETIQLLQSSAATCGVKLFRWEPIVWHQDLALAVTDKMPHLKRFVSSKCPEEHRSAFEAKCQFIT